jgi:hypothetical protein
MAIKLELFGENIEAFKRELETLAELVRPVVQATAAPVTVSLADAIKGVSFQQLHELVVAHFDREGYEVVIIEREPKPLTAVEAEAVVKEPAKAKGRPRLASVETAVKKLKGNGGQEPEDDPEADRKFVLDTLGKWVKDPARKAEVLAFAAKTAQAHGATKIVDLPNQAFPAIRRQMEKAFDRA